MNPKLQIVARAIEKGTSQKLRRAGADKTISVNELGGTRMAYLMLRPHVVSFLDAITRFDDEVLDLGEVTVQAGSALADSTPQGRTATREDRSHHHRYAQGPGKTSVQPRTERGSESRALQCTCPRKGRSDPQTDTDGGEYPVGQRSVCRRRTQEGYVTQSFASLIPIVQDTHPATRTYSPS